MKLRINGDSIRLRLSKLEVDEFVKEGQVTCVCHIMTNALVYSVIQGDFKSMTARFDGNKIQVMIPSEEVKGWDTDERIGFENTDDNKLFILVEKDFQCLKPRVNEDETDLFINPQAIE